MDFSIPPNTMDHLRKITQREKTTDFIRVKALT